MVMVLPPYAMYRISGLQTTYQWLSYGGVGHGVGVSGLSHLDGYSWLGTARWYYATVYRGGFI